MTRNERILLLGLLVPIALGALCSLRERTPDACVIAPVSWRVESPGALDATGLPAPYEGTHGRRMEIRSAEDVDLEPTPRAEVVVVDSRGRGVPHARVEVFFGRRTATYFCDDSGSCRVCVDDARILRVSADGCATCDVALQDVGKRAHETRGTIPPVEVVLPPAAGLAVVVRDDGGGAVAQQEVEVQVTGSVSAAAHVARRLSRWTDDRGLALFPDLAAVEYVVRCKRRGRWPGATMPAIRPIAGIPSEVVLQMQAEDRRGYLEVEIDDPSRLQHWDERGCANYVVVVNGETRTVRIPRRGHAVVAGRPGDRIAIRLAHVTDGQPRTLQTQGDWQSCVVGQARPVVLTIARGDR